jgi:hypothetical protein
MTVRASNLVALPPKQISNSRDSAIVLEQSRTCRPRHHTFMDGKILARNHVITMHHARELAAIAAVRKRIAHGYASVDPGRLWTELPAGLDG